MIIKTTLKEKLTDEYASKFIKSWEHYCVSSDSYQNGFNAARKLLKDYIQAARPLEGQEMFEMLHVIDTLGSNEVEIELKGGEHQLRVQKD